VTDFHAAALLLAAYAVLDGQPGFAAGIVLGVAVFWALERER
jgi:hypothetical protein